MRLRLFLGLLVPILLTDAKQNDDENLTPPMPHRTTTESWTPTGKLNQFKGFVTARPPGILPSNPDYTFSTIWATWSAWSFCVNGIRMRVRACNTVRGFSCLGSNKEVQPCDAFDPGIVTQRRRIDELNDYDVVDPWEVDRREAMKQLYDQDPSPPPRNDDNFATLTNDFKRSKAAGVKIMNHPRMLGLPQTGDFAESEEHAQMQGVPQEGESISSGERAELFRLAQRATIGSGGLIKPNMAEMADARPPGFEKSQERSPEISRELSSEPLKSTEKSEKLEKEEVSTEIPRVQIRNAGRSFLDRSPKKTQQITPNYKYSLPVTVVPKIREKEPEIHRSPITVQPQIRNTVANQMTPLSSEEEDNQEEESIPGLEEEFPPGFTNKDVQDFFSDGPQQFDRLPTKRPEILRKIEESLNISQKQGDSNRKTTISEEKSMENEQKPVERLENRENVEDLVSVFPKNPQMNPFLPEMSSQMEVIDENPTEITPPKTMSLSSSNPLFANNKVDHRSAKVLQNFNSKSHEEALVLPRNAGYQPQFNQFEPQTRAQGWRRTKSLKNLGQMRPTLQDVFPQQQQQEFPAEMPSNRPMGKRPKITEDTVKALDWMLNNITRAAEDGDRKFFSQRSNNIESGPPGYSPMMAPYLPAGTSAINRHGISKKKPEGSKSRVTQKKIGWAINKIPIENHHNRRPKTRRPPGLSRRKIQKVNFPPLRSERGFFGFDGFDFSEKRQKVHAAPNFDENLQSPEKKGLVGEIEALEQLMKNIENELQVVNEKKHKAAEAIEDFKKDEIERRNDPFKADFEEIKVAEKTQNRPKAMDLELAPRNGFKTQSGPQIDPKSEEPLIFSENTIPIGSFAAKWGEWSEWGSCFCGNQVRTRGCEYMVGYTTQGCQGSSYEARPCIGGPCPHQNPKILDRSHLINKQEENPRKTLHFSLIPLKSTEIINV